MTNFDKFNVRAVSEADRSYLAEVIARDPYHRHNMTPDFFLKLRKGEDAWAVEDDHGYIVMYFKTQTAVRFSCIFTRSNSLREKATNARVLRAGWNWLCQLLSHNGYREVLTDTQNPELEMFTKKVLGFISLPMQLSKWVIDADTLRPEENSQEHLQKLSDGGSSHVRIQ